MYIWSGITWAAKNLEAKGILQGKICGNSVLILLSETSFCSLREMDAGLGGPGQTKDDSYGFDMQLEWRHTLGSPWVVQACQAALNRGSEKHLWCKTALKHWMINRYCTVTEEKEQQRKDLQWKNRQLKATWRLKLPRNRRVLNSTSLCLC